MGENQCMLTGMAFNAAVRVEARDERLTDVGGAVLVREALERSGMVEWLRKELRDPRRADAITHPFDELVLTRLALIATGRIDQDDADVMRADPALRLAVSRRHGDASLRGDASGEGSRNPAFPQGLASQPTQSRLLKHLSSEENLDVLARALVEQATRRLLASNSGRRLHQLTLDIDGFPVDVEGHQTGTAYNGYYKTTVFHPLTAIIGESGDMVGMMLRRGNAHAATDFMPFVLRLVDALKERACRTVIVRVDAGMVSEQMLSALEAAGIRYIARVRNNEWLDGQATPFVRRPPGRRPDEPREWTHELTLKPNAWSKARRMILTVQERADELYLHHFWIVTNLRPERRDAARMLEAYRRRGLAESHIGEFCDVLAPRLSSAPRGQYSTRPGAPFFGPLRLTDHPDFMANCVTLLLHSLAYNAMHALRSLMPAQASGECWSLRRLRERVVCVAARVLLHGRRITLVITKSAARQWSALWPSLPLLAPPPQPG